MADLRNHDPLVEAVREARKEASRRPDLKFPVGRLNQIGKHVYAYSGMIAGSTGGQTTYLEFVTSSEYIRASVQQGSTNETTRKTVWIYFNDHLILRNDVDNSYPLPNTYDIIIPPFTKTKISLR